MRTPSPGEIYQHYKGNKYEILAMGIHTETGGDLVIYRQAGLQLGVYARPLNVWRERVTTVEGGQVNRFTLIQDADRLKNI